MQSPTGGTLMAQRTIPYSFSLSPRAGAIIDQVPNAGRGNRGKSAQVSDAIVWFFSSPIYDKEYTSSDDWRKDHLWTGKLVKSSHGVKFPLGLVEELESVYKQKAQLEARLASRPPMVRERRSLLARILLKIRAWLPRRLQSESKST